MKGQNISGIRPQGWHWLLILLTLAAILGVWLSDVRGLYAAPVLLTALSFVFSTLILLLVVYLLGRSFLKRGEPGLLLFGCGALIWAYGSIVASVFARRDVTLGPSIANASGGVAALCHMAGVGVSLWLRPRIHRVRLWLFAAYALAAGSAALITISAVAGWMPAFFIQGQGGTPLRYLVLTATIAMLVLTAVVLILGSSEPVSVFAYYYAIALILFAAGFFAVMMQTAVFSALFWTGLATQFAGGGYMLRAAIECVHARPQGEVSLLPLRTAWQHDALCAGIRQQTPLYVLARYAAAFGAIAAAAGLRTVITAWIGPGLPPYVVFIAAVTVVAVLAGFGPGLLATALAIWTVQFVDLAPGAAGAIASLPRIERVGLIGFGGMSVFISSVAGLYRRARDKAAAFDRERALYESRARLATFADATFEGIVETEADRLVDCNEQFARMTGYSVEQLKGLRITELVPPEDRAGLLAKHLDARQAVVECTLIRKDGACIFVEARSRPMPFDGQRHHTAVRDITDRKRTEQELLTIKERLEAYLTNAPLAVIEFDAAGRVLRWTGAAERIFGWTPDEIVGQSIYKVRWLVHDDPGSVIKTSENTQAGQCLRDVNISRHYRKDGAIVQCECYNSTLYDEAGQLTSVMSVALDVTHREQVKRALRQAEEQLKNHAAELEQVVRERTANLQATVQELEQYSYSISHDLRAPLRAMNEYAHFVLEMYGPTLALEGQTYLQRISTAAMRLDRLINDVLVYHRTVHDEMKLESIDLYSLIRDIIEQYPNIGSSTARIEIVGCLPHVWANVAALTQCLSNLLDNAIKFVAPGVKPIIKIWSETHGASVRTWIADNGIGIEPGQVERIWGLFQQADIVKASRGTGIGLSIVKKAVERMGGQVGVASVPGQGSQFWFELRPATGRSEWREEQVNTSNSDSALFSPKASPDTVRVLVIDDSEDDIFFLVRAMRANPRFRCVATVSSGQDAIRYFRREAPFSDYSRFPDLDLVVLDLKMPGMDGFSVLEYLQEHLPTRNFKVVVLTSSNILADKLRSEKLGADGFETKPADHSGYVQILKNIERSFSAVSPP